MQHPTRSAYGTINKKAHWQLVTVFLLLVGFFVMPAMGQEPLEVKITEISVTLYNSYTADHSLLTTGRSSGTVTYINKKDVNLEVHADTTSTYTISGDIQQLLTGNGTGFYQHQHTITLSTGMGEKTITTQFLEQTEPNIPEPLHLYLDQQAPTAPVVHTQQVVNNQHLFFNWYPSTDTGANGISYTLHLADNPGFTQEISFSTTSSSLLIEEEHIPFSNTTLYWHITAQDRLGNKQYGSIGFFTYATTDQSNGSPGGGDTEGETDQETKEITSLPHETDEETPHSSPDILAPYLRGTVPKYSGKFPSSQDKTPSLRVMLQNTSYPLDTITVFIPPKLLPKSGADADPLTHTILLIKYLPDQYNKYGLYLLLHKIIHIRYLGIMLLFRILGYNIETYKDRLFNFIRK